MKGREESRGEERGQLKEERGEIKEEKGYSKGKIGARKVEKVMKSEEIEKGWAGVQRREEGEWK